MAEQLSPETIASLFAETDRRLRNLETASRVQEVRVERFTPTAGVGWCKSTDIGINPPSYVTWQDGTASNTWTNNLGASGDHYARVSVTIGVSGQCVIIVAANPNALAVGATYKSSTCSIGVGVDGADPSLTTRYRLYSNSNSAPVNTQVPVIENISGLSVGTHEFKVWANFNNNGGAPSIFPSLNDISIVAIPL